MDVMWKTQPAIAGFEDGRVTWAKESRRLEAGGGEKARILPRASRKEHSTDDSLTLAQWDLFQTFDF